MEMKKAISGLVSTALVTGVLLLPAVSFSQATGTSNTPPAAGQTQQNRPMRHERHPEIRRALRHLNQAKNNLQKGAHDFGGHRAEALKLVDQAIRQCEEALQADKQ